MAKPCVPAAWRIGIATQHDDTEDLAINNTFWRRWYILCSVETLRRFRPYDGPCLLLTKKLIVKRGPFVHLTEAATMKYVAEKTSIPVPHIYCSFVHNSWAYIVMRRMPGKALTRVWTDLSQADLETICEQLKQMLAELRALAPPSESQVGSCVGGSLRDSRIPHARPKFGPFKTIQEFHLWLREGLKPEEHADKEETQDWADVKRLAAWQDGGPWPRVVFTHGDLNPSNILVDGNKITGIVDWDFSGWYPHYWEYTSAWYGNRLRPDWQDMIPRFLQPYPKELEMDIIRQKWWGDF